MNTNKKDIKITAEKSIAVKLIYAFTICVAVFFTIVFAVLNLKFEAASLSNTFALPIGILAMITVLFLMYKKQYKIAKYIVSIIPPFIVLTLSLMTKTNGFTDTVFLYLAPRMFVIVFLTVPAIFFGLNNLKQLIISCSILLIPAIFFDALHQSVGIDIERLRYDGSHYLVLIMLISMMYLFIFVSILFFQKTGLTFRTRMKKTNAELNSEKVEIIALNNKLDATLNELNHGIRYASYLQKSLLPDQATLNGYFKDCSVLYLPRDEVSGDFYFANGNKNILYFGVGDCTGHGIPGSLLASMSIEAVKHVIESNLGENPAEILSKLRHIAAGRFATNAHQRYTDSMDAALCLYDRTTGKLQFAGGYVNLYVVSATSEISPYMATKCPVGSYEIDQDFELHEVQLKKGDTLYISSDGYFDQFGMNPDSKKNKPQKYKRKRFLDFIRKIHHFDSQKQVDILFNELELWKQDLDQIDDVTVMVLKH